MCCKNAQKWQNTKRIEINTKKEKLEKIKRVEILAN